MATADGAVLIALDGDRLIAGASNHFETLSQQGAAYVFERAGTTWTQTAKLFSAAGIGRENLDNGRSEKRGVNYPPSLCRNLLVKLKLINRE